MTTNDTTNGNKIGLGKEFFFGGNATFTVENNKGEWYTFKISQPKEGGHFTPRQGEAIPHFAKLLTGPDNENSYTYLGMVKPQTGEVKLTRKSTYKEDSVPVRVLRWVLSILMNNKDLPEGYKVHHEGKCGCCGRKLTVPESIERGIGPECWSKMGGM